jgi:hypothetical protein
MTQDDVLFGYRVQLFAVAARTSVAYACRTFGAIASPRRSNGHPLKPLGAWRRTGPSRARTRCDRHAPQ